VGWQQEPAYVGQLNAVQLFLHDSRGDPINDLGRPPRSPASSARPRTRSCRGSGFLTPLAGTTPSAPPTRWPAAAGP
jgi:hypothetical protein